ncbi:MAG TPA: hypothetical protein VK442_01370 [Xanthobacteraceae bacterium]|nr:hypothetical protein [Xanthobacteraceae bacterium]
MQNVLLKNALRLLFGATLAGLLLASAGTPSDAARRASPVRAFDGTWSVVIYTEVGDCDRSLRYSVRIADGQVYADQQNYQMSGVVAANGVIRVTVAEGGRSASGAGRLVGNNGSGRWRTSTGECGGVWTAVRRPSSEY